MLLLVPATTVATRSLVKARKVSFSTLTNTGRFSSGMTGWHSPVEGNSRQDENGPSGVLSHARLRALCSANN